MIQIQDDAVQASANPNNSPSMPTSAYVPPAAPSDSAATPASMSAPAPAATPAPAPAKDNSAEIDRLLAELDKLSKDLDQQPAVATPTVSAPDAPMSMPAMPASSEAPETAKTEEKFDFDAFLSDLEKKIDQEAAKNQTAPVTQSSASATPAAPMDKAAMESVPAEPAADSQAEETEETNGMDFRKNRSSLDLAASTTDDSEKIVNPPTVSEMAEANSADNTDNPEDLKSQNIFEMLGLAKISDEEKNQFLDELEMMIWDDFVMHDLELLLTSEEYGQARQLLDDQSKSEDERKEALIVFLEKLVPDLDEVLYEKALELKSEMMAERLTKLKENNDPALADKVKQAQAMISENRWRSAATLLNSL